MGTNAPEMAVFNENSYFIFRTITTLTIIEKGLDLNVLKFVCNEDICIDSSRDSCSEGQGLRPGRSFDVTRDKRHISVINIHEYD